MDKNLIVKIFPSLASDSKYQVTSPEDPNYNCIAWAYQLFKDRWMAVPKGCKHNPSLDAVTWWPDNVTEGREIQCLIEAFEKNGFERCENADHENGFIKVALYVDQKNNKWTHAAREGREGKYWMSKLGQSFDIHHGTPYTIEGDFYGKVYCIMKMPN